MGKISVDITGKRYGRLIGLSKDQERTTSGITFWYFQCDCGKIVSKNKGNVIFGTTQSCGCLQKEIASSLLKITGLSSHSLFNTWKALIDRCINPNNKIYDYYGGRTIKVCDRWLTVEDHKGFLNFLDDMGEKPTPDHSIDRIDVNGNYEPSNCRWATKSEQSVNTRLRIDNSSGIKGVSFSKSQKKWFAELKYKNVRYRSKPFSDFESAKQWRLAKEKEVMTTQSYTKPLSEVQEQPFLQIND